MDDMTNEQMHMILDMIITITESSADKKEPAGQGGNQKRTGAGLLAAPLSFIVYHVRAKKSRKISAGGPYGQSKNSDQAQGGGVIPRRTAPPLWRTSALIRSKRGPSTGNSSV